MRKALISALVLLLASFILGATLFREQVAHAAQAVLPVLVTNDSSSPVPVDQQGTATVSVVNASVPVREQGTPTVDARQDGAWQVTAADNPALQPYHREVDVIDRGCATFEVPSGQRLVLEFVSALVRAGQGEHAIADFRVLRNGVFLSQAYSVPLTDDGFIDGYEWLGGSELVRVYVGPSTATEPVVVAGCFATSGVQGHLTMNFSGYLVDVP